MERCIKCSNCKHTQNETEFELYGGIRRKTCLICKEKRIKARCVHGKPMAYCVLCSGTSICDHGKRRSHCKECGGASMCVHGRQRATCKECFGSQICEHGKQRAQCKDCHGTSICIHGKHRSVCKECHGASICSHGKRRTICKDCHGSSICDHGRELRQCKICSPQLVIVKLIRGQIRRCFNLSTLNKINHSIEYLGCDVDTLKKHIQDKMTADMTLDNIHYDHIKPVSCFDLNDEEEFLKCCHFTNLQPLLAKDNLELKNTWTEENEDFWNDHIIYKPDFKDLYKV